MGSWIKKNIVSVTRGDSLWTKIVLSDASGNEYIPSPDDYILFSLKKSTNDDETPIVTKVIPTDTLELRLDPEDTNLEPGVYQYDVEITLNNGFVCTVVEPTKFIIKEQVGDKRRWP